MSHEWQEYKLGYTLTAQERQRLADMEAELRKPLEPAWKSALKQGLGYLAAFAVVFVLLMCLAAIGAWLGSLIW